ncbi:MAG: AmmeMemoRadiSam system protein B, partial [Spirochaetota bacterium]
GKKAASVTKQLGLEGCFIGSTDLTHYGPNYGFSPRGIGGDSLTWMKEVNDKRVIDLFLALDPEGVMKEASVSKNACCPGAAAAAISAVKEMGVEKGSLVEYATSYDVHPDTSFVGYAGVVY